MFRRIKMKLGDIRFKKRMAKQRYKRGFADEDCWGMNYWLTETFPKMILHLRDMKHGAPELPYEEYNTLPEGWKNSKLLEYEIKCKKEGYEFEEDSIFTKWYIILTRIAYCLEQANEDLEVYNKYKENYDKAKWGEPKEKETFKEMWDRYFNKVDNVYVLKQKEIDKELENNYWKQEEKNWKYKEQMKNEALDLIKKYFYNLWD